ncbi:MAG: hypothetical protein HYY04_14155 [Chloroflexi bacterium]|nr:hypothetical protein [Chloroflexota bacterium]
MEPLRKRLTLDLDPSFQRRLKARAALAGISMRQYCLSVIERELVKDEAREATPLPFGEEAIDRLLARQAKAMQGRKLPEVDRR